MSTMQERTAGHVLLVSDEPVSDQRSQNNVFWSRSMLIPRSVKSKAVWLSVHHIPDFLQGKEIAVGSYGSYSLLNDSGLSKDRIENLPDYDRQSQFMAVLRKGTNWPVYGFGTTVELAIENARSIARLRWPKFVDFTPQTLLEHLAAAEAAVSSDEPQPWLRDSLGPSVFAYTVPKAEMATACFVDQGYFDATDDPEPYSFQGTHYHEQQLTNIVAGDRSEPGTSQPVLLYAEDPSQARLVVSYHDADPFGDYYEHHENWRTFEAAFADAEEAHQYLQFRRLHSQENGWQIDAL